MKKKPFNENVFENLYLRINTSNGIYSCITYSNNLYLHIYNIKKLNCFMVLLNYIIYSI